MTRRDRFDVSSLAEDPLAELVRRADPVPNVFGQPAPGYELDRVIDDILTNRRELSPGAMPDGRRRRWWSRRRNVVGGVIGAVVFAVGGTTVATAILSHEPEQPAAPIACRAELRVDADAVVVPVSSDPIAACADVWLAGTLPDPDEPLDEPPATAPPLVACIGSGGVIEVFPADGGDGCDTIGLRAAAPTRSVESQRIIDLQDALIAATRSCVPFEDAAVIIEQTLAELELDGWRIERNPNEDRRFVCSSIGVDAATRTVHLGERPDSRPSDQTGTTR